MLMRRFDRARARKLWHRHLHSLLAHGPWPPVAHSITPTASFSTAWISEVNRSSGRIAVDFADLTEKRVPVPSKLTLLSTSFSTLITLRMVPAASSSKGRQATKSRSPEQENKPTQPPKRAVPRRPKRASWASGREAIAVPKKAQRIIRFLAIEPPV